MDERTLSISNIPVSFLEPLEKGKDLSGSELFLVSMPVSGEENSGYVSKSITYDTVISNLYADLKIEEISAKIIELENDLHVAAGVSYLSTDTGEPYNCPTVISAVAENNRGRIIDVFGYILSNAVSNILSNVVLPKLAATTAPWVKTSDVVSFFGDNETKVASQKLATEIQNSLQKYVSKDDITTTLGNGTDKVAAQSLVNNLCLEISSSYVLTSKITSDIGDDESKVASQKLANNLSTCVDTNFITNDRIAITLGDGTDLVAAQSLVKALSDNVKNNYVLTSRFDTYVPITNITSELGNSDRYVASQKLVTALCSEVSSKFPVGQPGQVYYLSSNGDIIKQTILNLDVYVCENFADITASINEEFDFNNVFTSWQKGGHTDSDKGNKWYGYDPDYPAASPLSLDTYGYPFWYYDDTKNTIVQPKNTVDYSFFVSQQNYSKYEVSCRLYSDEIGYRPDGTAAPDDDVIGLIVAYAEDSSGRPHTLSLIRTPNYGNGSMTDYHWILAYDYLQHIQFKEFIKTCVISTELNKDNDGHAVWNNLSGGVAVKMVRDENAITGWTGPFSQNKSEPGNINTTNSMYRISIDLDNPTSNTGFDTSKLNVFKGAAKIGFSTYSQPYTKYEVGTFNVPKIIIDSSKNSISSYYNGNWSTAEFAGIDPTSYVGIGRLVKNTATNKTFYVTTQGFIKFSEY